MMTTKCPTCVQKMHLYTTGCSFSVALCAVFKGMNVIIFFLQALYPAIQGT